MRDGLWVNIVRNSGCYFSPRKLEKLEVGGSVDLEKCGREWGREEAY